MVAVIHECLCTIAAIRAPPVLAEHAATCVGRFLAARGNNLKYLGQVLPIALYLSLLKNLVIPLSV